MFNTSSPENVVDINSYLAQPVGTTPRAEDAEAGNSPAADLVQTNKKLVTVVMGMTLMIGLVGCIAYLAGRAMTIARANGSPQISRQGPIVVDSPAVRQPVPSIATTPAAIPPTQPAVASSIPPPIVSKEDAPSAGQWYVQVGYVEASNIGSFRRGLEEKGFTTFAAAGDAPDARRVLLGPIPELEARTNLQQRLRAAGYESFPRRY